jgi:LysR family transcriptional regulator, transcription activator of glutamate synthase operon
MELRQLRYLEAVARQGHFTRAAEELHVAQSAVSHQIRRLEEELGVELLQRTTRSVQLTAAGRVAVARARAALAEADGLSGEIDELRGLARGTIAIGALLPAGPLDLPALLAEFNRRYPGIEIEFREGTTADMTAHLERGELDAAFVLESRPQPPGLGRLPLSQAEMVLAMSPAHPLAAKSPLPIARLDGENLIAFRHGSSVRHAMDQALERAGAVPRIALEGSDLLLIRALAAQGFGVAVLPRSFAELEGPPLSIRPLRPAIRLPVVLLWREGSSHSPAARAFLDFVAGSVTGSAKIEA